MDCADEATQIEAAVGRLPEVSEVKALVSAQCATVVYDPDRVTPGQIVTAIGTTGCSVRAETAQTGTEAAARPRDAGVIVGWVALGMVALVVLVATLGERLGLLDAVLERVPWWVPALAIVLGGWKVFRGALVVACVCAITMATPVVVQASVGSAARRGLLVKGGIALEQLAKVDTVVMDKSGTLTYGKSRLTDVVPLDGMTDDDLLRTVASVESWSSTRWPGESSGQQPVVASCRHCQMRSRP